MYQTNVFLKCLQDYKGLHIAPFQHQSVQSLPRAAAVQAACSAPAGVLRPRQRATGHRDKQEDSSATGKASRSSVASIIVLSVVSIFLHYRTGLALTVPKELAQRVSGSQDSKRQGQAALNRFSAKPWSDTGSTFHFSLLT